MPSLDIVIESDDIDEISKLIHKVYWKNFQGVKKATNNSKEKLCKICHQPITDPKKWVYCSFKCKQEGCRRISRKWARVHHDEVKIRREQRKEQKEEKETCMF